MNISNLANRILRAIGAASLVALLLAAGPGLFTSSLSVPVGGTFTTAATINAASSSNLVLNTISNQSVLMHYGDGATFGAYVYDGGTTNYSELRGLAGLTFSSGSTAYAYNGETVTGNGSWTGTGTFGGLLTANSGISTTSVTASSVSSSGAVSAGSINAVGVVTSGGANVTPVYNATGNNYCTTTHEVIGAVTGSGTIAVGLSGNAAFPNNSYVVTLGTAWPGVQSISYISGALTSSGFSIVNGNSTTTYWDAKGC